MPEITKPTREQLLRGLIAAGVVLLFVIALTVTTLLRLPGRRPAETEPSTEETEAPVTLPPNPYGPEDFLLDGPYLSCVAGQSVLGIDVSKHQGEIDWEQVREAGITFVMIRAGYRGWETGLMVEDEMAQRNYAGAKAAGLQVGAYFFSQAITVEEAREEATFALSITKDWALDMPLVFDWEYLNAEARTADMEPELLTQCALAFCQTVEAADVEPMLYFNWNMASHQIHLEALSDYRFWLAMYGTDMNYPYKVDMWQYTNQGSVPGISGNVDIDLYLPYE